MKKLEFCCVTERDHMLSFLTPKGLVQQALEKTAGDATDYEPIARAIAQLGLDGWQLVAVAGTGAYGTDLWFQRRIS
jgi:hypothetical protein